MTRAMVHGCVLCVALCWAASVRAGDVVAAAGELPDTVDALLVMEDARGFYRSPVGSTLTELAVRTAGFHETRKSWSALAKQLGMTEDEAIDALLGHRTIAAARWTEDGGIAWALTIELSAESERKIQRALKPAPRQIVGGHPVLALEGGAMEMVLAHTRNGAKMILGPAAKPALFLELVAALDRPVKAPLSNTALLREIARVGHNADGLVVYRSPQEHDLWFAFVADQRPLELEVNFLVGVPQMQERGLLIEPWSRQTFERISADAYLAVLDLNQFSWGENGGGIRVLSGLGLPLDLPPDLMALLSDRFALVITKSESGPVDAALALETVDTSAMARAGDRWLSTQLRGLTGDEKAAQRLEGLEQMPPTAVRTVDLSQLDDSVQALGWTSGPQVSWGARVDEAHCNAGQHHGWWSVGIGPVTVEELGRSVSAKMEQGRSLPWLSLGVARPAALVERLESSGVPLGPIVDPLRRVEEIRWSAMESGRGVILGNGMVVVSDKAQARANDGAAR